MDLREIKQLLSFQEFMGLNWDKFWDKRDTRTSHLVNTSPSSASPGAPRTGYAGMLDNPSKYQAGLPYQQWTAQWAKALLRILKPGGYLMSMGGTRTFHRMACGIEDAGFEIRDCIAWQYQQGFPKSHNISKGFDKRAGKLEERKVIENYKIPIDSTSGRAGKDYIKIKPDSGHVGTKTFQKPENMGKYITASVTDLAKQWDGWGTGLKPAWEPIVVARKPLEGSICENTEKYGTSGINIDNCRIPLEDAADFEQIKQADHFRNQDSYMFGRTDQKEEVRWLPKILKKQEDLTTDHQWGRWKETLELKPQGRWPANIIRTDPFNDGYDKYYVIPEHFPFIVVPKPSNAEKNRGCENLYWQKSPLKQITKEEWELLPEEERMEGNIHATIKPVELFVHLIKLVTPEPTINYTPKIIDPFIGSGTLGIAASLTNREFIGFDNNLNYITIARSRVKASRKKKTKNVKSLFRRKPK